MLAGTMHLRDWVDRWSLLGFAALGVLLGRSFENGGLQDLFWAALVAALTFWRLGFFLRRRLERQNKVSAGPEWPSGRFAAVADGEQELTAALTGALDELSRTSRQLMYELDVIASGRSTADASRQVAARLEVVRRNLSQLGRHWRNLLDLHPSHPSA
jgi:hypothetical protein